MAAIAVEEVRHDYPANRRDHRAEQNQVRHQHVVHTQQRQQGADHRTGQGYGLAALGAQQVAAGHGEVVDGVVLGAPDIEQQHGHRRHGKALQQQHFDHVRLLIDDGAVGADQHHQAIADKKTDQAGQHRHPGRARKARPVGGLGRAADKGAEHQGDGRGQVQLAGGHHRQQPIQAADFHRSYPHRQKQQDAHGRHCDVGQDLQPAITNVGRGTEQQAKHHHQRQHAALAQFEILAQHDRGGGRAPGIPADLGEAKDQIAELAAHFAKAETPHQHRVQPALERDVTQACGVDTQQQVTQGHDAEHVGETERHPQLAAGKHGRGKKRKAQQHHGGRRQAFARMHRDFAKGVIVARFLLRHVPCSLNE